MRDRGTLCCYCCGAEYERGRFKCCAAPSGLASHVWLEKFCHTCGTPTRGKCPNHCTCPKTKPEPVTIDNWHNTAKIAETVRKEWMPYRDPGEKGYGEIMMSALRPKTKTAEQGKYSPNGATAYLMVLNAVRMQHGLYHGKLNGPHGEHCAIGSYFAVNPLNAIPTDILDEVAAVNDSMPKATTIQRKMMVERWLKWKLTGLGMPGFSTKKL